MVKKAAHATPNQLLRAARKERGWTQQQVADRIGAPFSLNVSRWEAGTAQPSAYYLERLCQLFGKSVSELGLSQIEGETQDKEASRAAPQPDQKHFLEASKAGQQDRVHLQTDPRIGTLPYPRNPFFLGREDVLTRLRRQLQASQAIALSQPQAICGLGGVGKTQVALEYAYRYAQDYQAIFWARADSHDTLVESFLEMAHAMQLPERDERDQGGVVAAVKAWLSQNTGWLLIMDNADELTLLLKFLPSPLTGHVLLTTRAQALGGLASRIEIETLDLATAPLLLLRRAGLLALDAPFAQAEPNDWQAAVQLSQELGGLPLALDQAGAYLEETRCSLQQYLVLYRSHRADLLRYRGGLVLDHPDSVATTWALSFARIEQRSPSAADLLRLCSLLHPDAIPEEIFLRAAAHLGPTLATIEIDPLAFNKALAVVQSYSLLRRNGRERMLSIHRLVQAVLTDAMAEKERDQWIERAIVALNAVFPEMMHQGWEQWEQCGRLLPHVLAIAAATPQAHSMELASLLTKAADYLRQRAQYEQAEPLFLRALSMCEQMLGREHPQAAYPLHGLACLHREQSNYQQAELLFLRALHICEQQPDQEHPEIAALLNDLSLLYWEQGDYQQAELLLLRALHLDEQMFGPEYSKIATRLNNLAILYCEKKQYKRAEPLLLRALHLDEQTFGPEHPDITFPLTNLAECYQGLGRYAEAESLYLRALHIREQTLGREHPLVAHPLNGLANLYRDQGRYTEAEPLYQRSLTIRQQQLGDQHPETAESLHDFARLYELRNQPDQALALYQRALAIRERRLGPEHPRIVETRACCARLLRAGGQSEEISSLAAGSDHQRRENGRQ